MKNKREKGIFKYRYTHMHTSISNTEKKNQEKPEERMYGSSVVFKAGYPLKTANKFPSNLATFISS